MIERSFSIAAVSLALLCAGCSRSPRVDFYTLAPVAGETAPPQKEAVSVVVGPVSIPEVVDRPQLVVRVAENRVDILETHRWAEPLKTGIPRILAQDLGRLLGSKRVYSYQEFTGATAEWRVLLDMIRFDSVPGDSVTVEADWSIRRAGGPARHGHSLIREKVSGAGYDPVVAAYNRALLGLSADISKALKEADTPAKQSLSRPTTVPP